MQKRNTTLSIQKNKLLRITTFSIVLIVIVTMILSSAAQAININMDSTQINVNNSMQNQLLEGDDSNTDLAPQPDNGQPTMNVVEEKQADHQPYHRGIVVYDNTLNYYTLTSNQDDSVYGIDSEGADDFSFYTGGEDVCIEDVHWIGGVWDLLYPYVDFPWHIRFWEDDGTGNLPGELYAGPFTVTPKKTLVYQSGITMYYEFSADIDEVCFPGCGEKFWIDIQADHDYPPQYGWAAHYSPVYNHQLVWKSSYFGYPDWVDCETVFGIVLDYAFQLTVKADHDVSAIKINTGDFCTCLPIELVVANYGKFDEINVPVHITLTQIYATYKMDDFFTNWTQVSGTGFSYVYSGTNGVTAYSQYYMMMYNEQYASSKIQTIASFDFSDACNPYVSFWMWHDTYGSDDYIQVTADGAVVGPKFYRSEAVGWEQHFVELPTGITKVGFLGVSDGIIDAYPLYIDDVQFGDVPYDQIHYVDIDVGEEVNIDFDYCPCQLGNVENVIIPVYINSCIEMETDQVRANDCLINGPVNLYLSYFHDLSGVDLTITEQGCNEFTVCATVANLGQFQECCFKTYVNIWEFLIGDWNLLYSQNFEVYSNPIVSGWQRSHNNWARVYSYYPKSTYNYVLRFSYSPSVTGTLRAYMTEPVNTIGLYELQIKYVDYLDYFNGPFTLAFQTSIDGVNWVSAKEWINPTGWLMKKQQFNIQVNGASQMYFAFAFIGDSFNVDYWYIDDFTVLGRTGELGFLDYSTWYCVDTINTCETLDFCFENWVPDQSWVPCNSKFYKACVKTVLCDPMDENPVNDEYCAFLTVDFLADVEARFTEPEESGGIAYAYANDSMIAFDLASPGTYTILGPYTGPSFAAAGTWAEDEWYVTDYSSALLMSADITTGELTIIGGSGTPYNGIAFDYSTGTLYGVSNYNLYTIDTGTGAQTMVGSWGSSYLMIDIGIDTNGVIYGHDIITDSMYIINQDTAAVTLLGPTGQFCNYAQGMEYDHANNILYAAAYTSSGNLFTVDTTTGWFTLVGGFAEGIEVDALAIPFMGGGGGCPPPGPDIWIPCGEKEICATILNNGIFDYVDNPITPCEYEAITLNWQLDWYYITDPCESPIIETVLTGSDAIELLCNESKEYCIEYDFQETGLYKLILWATADPDCDLDNNLAIFDIGVDCCDPISEHTITPIVPDGCNNWYSSDVTVKITAYDPLCPDQCYGTSSHIEELHYVINGVETVKENPYITIKLKDDGVNLIEYWAVDHAGNIEDKFTFEVAIDKTIPSIDLIYENIKGETLVIKFAAVVYDATSSISKVEFYIDNIPQTTKTTPPFIWEVPWQESYKTTIFKAIAYDSACNYAIDSTNIDISIKKVLNSPQVLIQNLLYVASQSI